MKVFHIAALFVAAVVLPVLPARAILITFDDLPDQTTTIRDENPHPDFPDDPSRNIAVRPGGHTSLVLSAGGVTVTITRENGTAFDLVDNDPDDGPNDNVFLHGQQDKSEVFGKRSLDPFSNTSNNGFIFNFSDPIKVFGLIAGDYGFDADSLSLFAYSGANATGTIVAQDSFDPLDPNNDNTIPAKFANGQFFREWDEQRFDVNVGQDDPGFQSVLFKGGAVNMSVFVDRIAFELGSNQLPGDDELDDPSNTGTSTTFIPEPTTTTLMLCGAAAAALTRRRSRP